jgi:hypothetical protein
VTASNAQTTASDDFPIRGRVTPKCPALSPGKRPMRSSGRSGW